MEVANEEEGLGVVRVREGMEGVCNVDRIRDVIEGRLNKKGAEVIEGSLLAFNGIG